MITSKQELAEFLQYERKLYISSGRFTVLKLFLLCDHDYLLWKYIKALRYTEYYFNMNKKIQYWFWQRIKNKRGRKLGITIWHNTIDKGLRLWHYGSVIINGHARIGGDCQFHGNNCVGNKGEYDQEAPTIGNNVDIGLGAVILGNVYIADNVKIGANAVVTKSCYKKGATLVGVPARMIK